MISARIEADTLEEYYTKLCKLQSDAHGEDYLLVHDEIRSCLSGCFSYTEFGINQGATLAAAMLTLDPVDVSAYDIKLGWYSEAAELFDDYAVEWLIDFNVTETDTLDCTIDPVDVLYIDTLHKKDHLLAELALHADKVRRYIIFHDTTYAPGLKQAVLQFVGAGDEWRVVTECTDSVGFMTIERV